MPVPWPQDSPPLNAVALLGLSGGGPRALGVPSCVLVGWIRWFALISELLGSICILWQRRGATNLRYWIYFVLISYVIELLRSTVPRVPREERKPSSRFGMLVF